MENSIYKQFHAEIAALTPEQELVLRLANIRHPYRQRIEELLGRVGNWPTLLGYMSYNRTAGLGYYVLQQCNPAETINGDFLLSLQLHFEAQKLRTLALRKHIAELAEQLNLQKIRYAFLKGSVLTTTVYPLGCRTSNDIDILVHPSDLTECSQVLKKMGFIQGFFHFHQQRIIPATRTEIINHRMNFGELVPFHKWVNEHGLSCLTIDVNFSLNEVALNTQEAVDHFLQKEHYYKLDSGHSIRILGLEFFLAHLCVHLYKEATVLDWVKGMRDLSLYKFVDIFMTITDPNHAIDWLLFVDVVQKNRIDRECFYALYFTIAFFPELLDNQQLLNAMQQLRPDNLQYLHEVTAAGNKDERYRWQCDIYHRLFDLENRKLTKVRYSH